MGSIASPVFKVCPTCGVSFRVKPSHYDKKTYCSKSCMATGYKTRLRGDANPNHKNAGQKICEGCGKPYQSYNKTRRFCSVECYSKTDEAKMHARANSVKARGVPHLSRRKAVKERHGQCKSCGISFVAPNKRTLCDTCLQVFTARGQRICVVCGQVFRFDKSRKTCSRRCFTLLRSQIQKGSRSHRWQGGKTVASTIVRNSAEYALWRHDVFTRDDFTCQLCHKRGNKLAAHHIKRFATHFNLALLVANGISLCWPCHRSIKGKETEYEAQFYAITGGVDGQAS